MEQRVGDGLQVLECAFLNKTKYLNLAFVLRVIDDEEVDGVIYKTAQCLVCSFAVLTSAQAMATLITPKECQP